MKTFNLVTSIFVFLAINSSFAQITWIARISNSTSDLYSVAWTGTQLVAVGDNGTIRTSPDGITWTSRTSGTTTKNFNSVTWTGSLLVVVGDTCATSPDGITWTLRAAPRFNSVTWASTQAVAVGSGGRIYTSGTGTQWSSELSGTTDGFYGVAWSGSMLAAVGWDATGANDAIHTSPNGINWTNRNTGTFAVTLGGVVWGNGQFVAVGGDMALVSNASGTGWGEYEVTPTGPLASLLSVTWGSSQFVAVGNSGQVFTSSTGIAWTSRTSGTTTRLNSVTWTGTQFVAVGASGAIRTSSPAGAILPGFGGRSGISIRITPATIFAALPNILSDQKSSGAIYSITGNKLVKAFAMNGAMAFPVGGLALGRYLFEVNIGGTRYIQSVLIGQ